MLYCTLYWNTRPAVPAPALLAAAFVLLLSVRGIFAQDAAAVGSTTPSQDVSQLVDVIQSDASPHEKAMACRRLAVVGDASTVPALIGLLGDAQLATYARTALEAIPGEDVDRELRKTLEQVEGAALAGVAGSIGKRRDAGAVDVLATLLSNEDSRVVSAAAWALAEIGNQAASRHLTQALAESADARREILASACLHCAAVLHRDGAAAEALAMYDALRKAELPEHLRLAATQRLILARTTEEAANGDQRSGLNLLQELLSAEDRARFRAGLQAARELGGVATPVLVQSYQSATDEHRALIVLALADIGDAESKPTLLEAASPPPPDTDNEDASRTRVEAIHGLARLEAIEAVPTLLQALVEEDEAVSQAALSALSQLQAADLGEELDSLLMSDDPRIVRTAITLAQRRQAHSATPALLDLARQGENTIRVPATEALGATIQIDDVKSLLTLAMSSADEAVRSTADAALRTATIRLPRPETTQILEAAMQGASTDNQVMILEQLTQLGGPDALRIVAAAASSDDSALQDAGTRLLGTWPNSEAAQPLLQLAQNLQDERFRLRSLRGYIRMARMSDLTPEARLEIARTALELADLAEDKKRVLEALRINPSAGGLRLAATLVDDSELRGPALAITITMAERLVEKEPETVRQVLGPLKERAASDEQRARMNAILERAAVALPE